MNLIMVMESDELYQYGDVCTMDYGTRGIERGEGKMSYKRGVGGRVEGGCQVWEGKDYFFEWGGVCGRVGECECSCWSETSE